MKEYKNIFLLIEQDLEEKKEKIKEYYQLYCKVDNENQRLKQEIKNLRNDLFELSREHFKK